MKSLFLLAALAFSSLVSAETLTFNYPYPANTNDPNVTVPAAGSGSNNNTYVDLDVSGTTTDYVGSTYGLWTLYQTIGACNYYDLSADTTLTQTGGSATITLKAAGTTHKTVLRRCTVNKAYVYTLTTGTVVTP